MPGRAKRWVLRKIKDPELYFRGMGDTLWVTGGVAMKFLYLE